MGNGGETTDVIDYPYIFVVGLIREVERDVRDEIRSADGITTTVYLMQLIPNGIVSWILLPINFLVMIPRMLLWAIPGVNLVFILINQAIYMAILGPVVGTSLLWGALPNAARWGLAPAIMLVGVPFSILGNVQASLCLMGGPDEHGANKEYKLTQFQVWPFTVSYRRRVRAALDETGFSSLGLLNG